MDDLIAVYNRILEVLQKISQEQLLLHQRRKPKSSDLELISLCLTSEYLSIDSENDLFRKLPMPLSSRIERSVYYRCRPRLLGDIEEIRFKLPFCFNEFENVFIEVI